MNSNTPNCESILDILAQVNGRGTPLDRRMLQRIKILIS